MRVSLLVHTLTPNTVPQARILGNKTSRCHFCSTGYLYSKKAGLLVPHAPGRKVRHERYCTSIVRRSSDLVFAWCILNEKKIVQVVPMWLNYIERRSSF